MWLDKLGSIFCNLGQKVNQPAQHLWSMKGFNISLQKTAAKMRKGLIWTIASCRRVALKSHHA